ncbi:hypothetical protein [Lewinella sp. W8]|uniref:hypothetical protein n=1 Tax=Lewinella sp. W8 TaxID=2528208 RepID=UPI001067F580|nr:hypothetical protein [Lewinella sp. W8]MTB49437.1 hypothetical protein [Lewinella sp. W8]
MADKHQQTTALLSAAFELSENASGRSVNEDQFIQWLADVVDYWMQHRMERLMSLCYTLDVSEAAVAEALHPNAPEPANVGLARLLYERQLKRLETKERFKPEMLDDEDAW